MKPRWHRRLDAARDELLEQGPRITMLLSLPSPIVHDAMIELLASVGLRERQYLDRYFEKLMRLNRRG